MDEIDLIIDIRAGEDSDLMAVLAQYGIRAKPHYGVSNGPMPDVSEMLKHPAPYIWATATAAVLRTAIKAYADSKKKRFIISRLKSGIKVDATNYSVDELKDMGVLDIGNFESENRNTSKPCCSAAQTVKW